MKIRILNQTEDDGFDFKKPQGIFNKITSQRGIGRSGPSDQIRTTLIREKEREVVQPAGKGGGAADRHRRHE
jgi:hypothetical protein